VVYVVAGVADGGCSSADPDVRAPEGQVAVPGGVRSGESLHAGACWGTEQGCRLRKVLRSQWVRTKIAWWPRWAARAHSYRALLVPTAPRTIGNGEGWLFRGVCSGGKCNVNLAATPEEKDGGRSASYPRWKLAVF
jgi:hypothetical protein